MKLNFKGLKNPPYVLSFHSIRNISSPEDLEGNRRVYSGQTTVNSILDLPTDENVRSYLLDAVGRQKKRQTAVHRAIQDTVLNYPNLFSVLNTGITIVARDLEIDEKEKKLLLQRPSIINGAQTQGVLNDINKSGMLPDPPVHIKFEIIVTDDEDLIAEVSIARNFQNDVMSISIAGRRGQLDELEESLKKVQPDLKLRKSETELPNADFVDTEKLIQVIAALVPQELTLNNNDPQAPNKVYTYSMKSKCLKDFQEIHRRAHDKEDPQYSSYKRLYEFYLQIAPQAYHLYYKWKSHKGFVGTRLRSLERDEFGAITDIPDGIVFPILAALSVFAVKTDTGWKILPPAMFKDEELIRSAKSALIDIAAHNPQTMGKSKACYSALMQITSIYKRLLS